LDPEYLTYADIAHTSEFKLSLYTGTVAIADESIPIEATAAAEAQQVALDYGNEKDKKSESSESP